MKAIINGIFASAFLAGAAFAQPVNLAGGANAAERSFDGYASAAGGFNMESIAGPAHQEYVLTAEDLGAKRVELPLGKAAIIRLPRDVRDLLISDPDIADAVIRTPRRIYLLGLREGQTSAFFFDSYGNEILTMDINVNQDISGLAELLEKLLPESLVQVDRIGESVVLSGEAANNLDAERAVQLATQFIGGDGVVNLMNVRGKQQVLLKARIVEMNRNVSRQFGISMGAALDATNLDATFGLINNFGASGAAQRGFFAELLGTNGEYTSIDGIINAFERNGVARTLAEPNVVAVSGEPAQFLAGGEFPIPVGQDDNGRITITFKKFGVSLAVTPYVLDKGRINLDVKTEVSELTTTGAFSAQGVTVPGVSVRRAETTVEVPSGSSLMIAGLIQDGSRSSVEGMPGLRNVPVLGALFRSKDHQIAENELVIIVSPYLVGGVPQGRLQDPDQGYEPPAALFSGSRLNKVRSGAATHSPCGTPPCGTATGGAPVTLGAAPMPMAPPPAYGQPGYPVPGQIPAYPPSPYGHHGYAPMNHAYPPVQMQGQPGNAVHHGSYAATHAFPSYPAMGGVPGYHPMAHNMPPGGGAAPGVIPHAVPTAPIATQPLPMGVSASGSATPHYPPMQYAPY